MSELRATPEVLALECGLLPCSFAGECNSCEAPEGRTWASISSTQDGEEVNCYVCEKCLPKFHADYLKELKFWDQHAAEYLQELEDFDQP